MATRRVSFLLSLAILGCADAGAPPGGRDAAARPDAAAGDALAPLDARVRRDAGGGRGGFKAPCVDNLDCESRWCVPFGDLDVCTITCLDDGCPDGWGCRTVSNTGADAVSICFPPRDEGPLCRPCDEDADCPGGRCYRLGDARVCGVDCRGDQGCPEAYDCRAVLGDGVPRQCVPRTLTCVCDDCDAGVPDASTPDAQPRDAMVVAMDAAPDMAPPAPDLGAADMAVPPAPDLGPPDMAPPPPDMAPPPPDMAPPPPDMAPPPPDMAPPPPDMAPPPPDMAPPPPDMAPPPRLPYGAPCDRAVDCESDLCVGDPATGRGRCTRRCALAADCPDLDTCLPADGGVNVCFRNETGTACLNGAGCIEGICLTPPDPVPWVVVQPICISRCRDNRKCPAGYRCDVVQTNRGPERACTPDVEVINTCPNGFIEECVGTCATPPNRDELDLTVCLGLGDGEPGYCSCTCATAADCPDGFACSRVGLSHDGTRPGVCLAMSGYRCPLQGRPGVPEQCLSLTCATPDEEEGGQAASFCTAPCVRDVDCPAGHTCEFFDGEGACVPAP